MHTNLGTMQCDYNAVLSLDSTGCFHTLLNGTVRAAAEEGSTVNLLISRKRCVYLSDFRIFLF